MTSRTRLLLVVVILLLLGADAWLIHFRLSEARAALAAEPPTTTERSRDAGGPRGKRRVSSVINPFGFRCVMVE